MRTAEQLLGTPGAVGVFLALVVLATPLGRYLGLLLVVLALILIAVLFLTDHESGVSNMTWLLSPHDH